MAKSVSEKDLREMISNLIKAEVKSLTAQAKDNAKEAKAKAVATVGNAEVEKWAITSLGAKGWRTTHAWAKDGTEAEALYKIYLKRPNLDNLSIRFTTTKKGESLKDANWTDVKTFKA